MKRLMTTPIFSLAFLALTTISAPAAAYIDTAWTDRYAQGSHDKAYALTVDDSGYIYVTGESMGVGSACNDYLTIKYKPNGDTAWVRRFNIGDFSMEEAHNILVDDSGNVYVTGYSFAGNWIYVTVKYDRDGSEIWNHYEVGPNFGNRAYSLAVDKAYNLYVTGTSENSAGDEVHVLTIKYAPDGNIIWRERYDSPDYNYQRPARIATDDSANFYIAGYAYGTATHYDAMLLKYDSSGNLLWDEFYNSAFDSSDFYYDMIIDDSAFLYSVGGTNNPGNSFDVLVTKYDSAGTQKWLKTYNSPFDTADVAYSAVLDDYGHLCVGGRSFSESALDDYLLVKYDTAGNELWSQRYNGPTSDVDLFYDLAVDSDGNIGLTGQSWGGPTLEDYATVMYDSSGNLLWTKRYNGPSDSADIAHGIAIDPSGAVIVTGESRGIGTREDYLTLKYVASSQPYVCGDAGGDETVNILDVTYLINYLYKGGPAPEYPEAADVNSDAVINILDVTYLINFLYRDGPEPSCP